MKAIILAAGHGQRLKQDIPKCLTVVVGRTILERQVTLLKNYVDEIIVVTGYKHEMVDDVAEKLGCIVVWNFLSFFENIVSLYFGVLKLNESFIILNGDTLVSESIVKRIIVAEGNVLGVQRWFGSEALDDNLFYHDYDKEAMKVEFDGKKILNVDKKIGRWEAWGEYIGIAKIVEPERLREELETLIRNENIHIWYDIAFNSMIKNGMIFRPLVLEALDIFSEIDTPEDLEEAIRIWGIWDK